MLKTCKRKVLEYFIVSGYIEQTFYALFILATKLIRPEDAEWVEGRLN